uniref:HotDog ACOT-type domain-containing protein n=1 Tax=Molossus molossus TaxID=27622 RepID=A0A7J8GKW5_MOLMO|nr:hypothetical protein HJG59_011482 [Molossus molossus]
MKLMDQVARIVAARHCKTNIVTASVDAINLHDKIRKGCIITISGRMTFTSNTSMEMEVLVDTDPVVDNSQERYQAASAFFTYVSLSQDGRLLPVPQLVPRPRTRRSALRKAKGGTCRCRGKGRAKRSLSPRRLLQPLGPSSPAPNHLEVTPLAKNPVHVKSRCRVQYLSAVFTCLPEIRTPKLYFYHSRVSATSIVRHPSSLEPWGIFYLHGLERLQHH